MSYRNQRFNPEWVQLAASCSLLAISFVSAWLGYFLCALEVAPRETVLVALLAILPANSAGADCFDDSRSRYALRVLLCVNLTGCILVIAVTQILVVLDFTEKIGWHAYTSFIFAALLVSLGVITGVHREK